MFYVKIEIRFFHKLYLITGFAFLIYVFVYADFSLSMENKLKFKENVQILDISSFLVHFGKALK